MALHTLVIIFFDFFLASGYCGKSFHGDITYVDQGVLNGVLAKKNLVKVIHTKYDAMTVFFDFNFKDLMKVRRPEHHLSEEEYIEAVTDPYIIHYTSCFLSGTRPWNENNLSLIHI